MDTYRNHTIAGVTAHWTWRVAVSTVLTAPAGPSRRPRLPGRSPAQHLAQRGHERRQDGPVVRHHPEARGAEDGGVLIGVDGHDRPGSDAGEVLAGARDADGQVEGRTHRLPVWPICQDAGAHPSSTAAREAPTAAPSTRASSSRSRKPSGPPRPRPPETTIVASSSAGPAGRSATRSTICGQPSRPLTGNSSRRRTPCGFGAGGGAGKAPG